MANFPDIAPSVRTYTPGTYASTQLRTLLGEEASVQHNNSSVGHRLSMTFSAISSTNQTAIYNHYLLHGRFTPFELDSSTIQGSSSLTFPAGHKWIYASSPQIDKTCPVTTMRVELELIPDYTI
jgi:hypothetical protein